MKQPVAYLRKSRVTNDRHVSWEVQLASVKEMAIHHGDQEPMLLSDWNKSGRKGAESRPGYKALIEMIERDQVSAVYSYSLSRLSRSLAEFARLVDLCQARSVPIRLHAEQHLDFTTASGRLMVSILAAFAQMEGELAQERSRDTVAVRRARGDHIGGKPFENVQAVIDAYREANSCTTAALLLGQRGITTRNGNRVWSGSSVRVIIERVAPELLPHRRVKGLKKAAPFYFFRLIRCKCGTVMTASRNQHGYVTYRCHRGGTDPLHGKLTCPEPKILAWAKAEAARLCPPPDAIQLAGDTLGQQNALRERKVRLRRAFVDGLYVDAEYQVELAAIDKRLNELELQGRAITLEPISWEKEPAAVNQALRALWSHVQLDDSMDPAFAEWVLPEWRGSTPEEQPAPGSLAAAAA